MNAVGRAGSASHLLKFVNVLCILPLVTEWIGKNNIGMRTWSDRGTITRHFLHYFLISVTPRILLWKMSRCVHLRSHPPVHHILSSTLFWLGGGELSYTFAVFLCLYIFCFLSTKYEKTSRIIRGPSPPRLRCPCIYPSVHLILFQSSFISLLLHLSTNLHLNRTTTYLTKCKIFLHLFIQCDFISSYTFCLYVRVGSITNWWSVWFLY